MKIRRISNYTSVILSFFVLLCFVLFNMRDIIFGAPLSITGATDGTTINATTVSISGNAGRAAKLLINSRPVSIDRSGAFSDEILLSTGYNIVEVARTDRFGKEKVRTLHLVSTPTTAVARAPSVVATN